MFQLQLVAHLFSGFGEGKNGERGAGERWLILPSNPWTCYLLPPMYGGCGTGCRWFAITTKVNSPSHPYVCCIYLAPPLLRVPIGRVWGEVFLLQAWDDLKWKVIPASHPCWTRQLILSTLLFNKINKQQFGERTSKCWKRKWNHEPKANGFTAKFWTFWPHFYGLFQAKFFAK